MRVINNDPFVAPLKCDNLSLIKRVYDYLQESTDQAYQADVYLFETIHGHIVMFRKKEGRYSDKGAERLDHNDLKFYGALVEKLRWSELGHYEISLGLKRCK